MLTTRLPRFPTGCRCLNKNKNGTFCVLDSAQCNHRLRLENYKKKVISVFGKLHVPVPLHLHFGKNEDFFHYIWGKIHKTGENKAIFALGTPPITGGKTGQIKSLTRQRKEVKSGYFSTTL